MFISSIHSCKLLILNGMTTDQKDEILNLNKTWSVTLLIQAWNWEWSWALSFEEILRLVVNIYAYCELNWKKYTLKRII